MVLHGAPRVCKMSSYISCGYHQVSSNVSTICMIFLVIRLHLQLQHPVGFSPRSSLQQRNFSLDHHSSSHYNATTNSPGHFHANISSLCYYSGTGPSLTTVRRHPRWGSELLQHLGVWWCCRRPHLHTSRLGISWPASLILIGTLV